MIGVERPTQTTPSGPGTRSIAAALERYLARSSDGFRRPARDSPIRRRSIEPHVFPARRRSGEYVLRKKPPGHLLPSAHAVDREYRVMTALADTDVPVPPTLLMCDDAAVIGTPFFVMACVDGRVFRQPHLPGVSAADRACDVRRHGRRARALHGVDVDRDRPRRLRQAGQLLSRARSARWGQQYVAAKTGEIPVDGSR